MVKFVGGPSPNAYKSYKNHTVAREGQFRIPRPTGSVKQVIKITNIDKCDCTKSSYGCFQLPEWAQWAQCALDTINSYMPQPKVQKETEPEPEPETNPFAKELADLKAELETLKKENEQLKAKPTPASAPEKPDKNTDSSEISITPITTEAIEAKEGELLTTPAEVRKGKKLSDGRVEYQGWQTLANAYGIPNTRDFRNWFRKEYLEGKDIWNLGTTQNFPTTIKYNNQEYTFKAETFATAADYHTPSSGSGSISTNNMGERRGPGTAAQAATTTYSGTVTATINGQTYTATDEGYASADAVKTALTNSLKDQGLTDEQADNAIRNARVKGNES